MTDLQLEAHSTQFIIRVDNPHQYSAKNQFADLDIDKSQTKREYSLIQTLLLPSYQKSKELVNQQQSEEISYFMKQTQYKVLKLETEAPKKYLSQRISISNPISKKKLISSINKSQQMESNLVINKSNRGIQETEREILNKLDYLNDDMKNLSLLDLGRKRISLDMNMRMFDDKKYWDLNNQKSHQVRSFVKKLSKQRKKLARNLIERYTKNHEELLKMQKFEQQEKQKLRNEKIRQELKKKIEIRKSKILSEEKHHNKQDSTNKYFNQVPLFKIYEQEYQKIIQQQENQRASKLQQIKNKFKPIDIEAIEQHQKKYLEIRNLHLEQLKNQTFQKQHSEKYMEKVAQLYQGKAHEIVQQEQRILYQKRFQGKLTRQKMEQYRKIIQQNHRPKIDQQKRKEIQMIKLNQQNKRKKLKKKILQDGSVVFQENIEVDAKKLGDQYLQSAKKIIGYMKSASTVIKKQKKIQNSQQDLTSRKKDYLRDIFKDVKPSLSNWKKQLQTQNLTKLQKYERILKKTQILDEKARLQQLKAKFIRRKPEEYFENREIVDQYYMNSINAKLSVLNQVLLK